MTTETLLLVILLIMLVGAFPSWPYSRSWGAAPSAVFSVLLIIFLVWIFAGDRPLFRSSSGNIETTIQDAGREIKSTGRDVADSIRDVVQ